MNFAQQVDIALEHHRAGRLAEAEKIYREVLAIDENYVDALHLLGVLAGQLGRADEAVELIRRAVALKSNLVIGHNNLGNVLRDMERREEAVAAFTEAIRQQQDYAAAHNNLALTLKAMGRLDEAVESFRRAIHYQPDLAEAYSNLAGALQTRGDVDEAIGLQRQAVRMKPDYPNFQSGLLYAMNFQSANDAGPIFNEHQIWDQRHAEPLRHLIQLFAGSRDPERTLRIGYVSADFRQHSVGHFILPLIETHNPQMFEIFCYANGPSDDDMGGRMKAAAHGWRSILGLTDDAMAKKIREDQIDILVDLSGHTAGNRLQVFARKPAPIQVTYLGYPNTTGLKAIDFRFTDALADPPGMTDRWNVEKLWRLPVCAWCFHAPADSLPMREREPGPIRFGCFNAFIKINPRLISLWAQLLKSVPDSRLVLKSSGGHEANLQQRIAAQFAELGVDPQRIEILGWVKNEAEHLQRYQQIDVALDTYPYHGTTTTCQALWMGVPVVCLAGQTHLSRVGVSLLTNVGLAEFIANSPQEYITIAAKIAADPARLAELRSTLRERMRKSPLMDAARFARDVEAAYRQMWRQWCSKESDPNPATRQELETAWGHHRAGRLGDAELIYRQILARQPQHAEALHLLAVVEARKGNIPNAIGLLRKAIAADPNVAKYHTNLGAMLMESGRMHEALESFQHATALAPEAADAAVGLGNALRAAGKTQEATKSYQRALDNTRADADGSNLLGIVLNGAGREDESLLAFRQALDIRPGFPEAQANLAAVLAERGELKEAEILARKALQAQPQLSAAHSALAKTLTKMNRFDEAIAEYEEAVRLGPGSAVAWNNLACALVDIGEIDRQLECLQRAMQLDPKNPILRSSWVNRILYHPSFDSETQLAEAKQWDEVFGRPLAASIKPHANDRSPNRKIRIGYVSPDFRDHVLGNNVLPLIRERDATHFEVFCYSNSPRLDKKSLMFKSAADAWRQIHGLGDDVVAEMIRNDRIDILVDLALHTSGNRLPVFARKAAPVQVTFAGYPGTTGLNAIDYRLTDPHLDPEGQNDQFYSERSIRLPHSFWCYDPDAMDVAHGFDVAPLPALTNGYVTFGCLNSFSKVNASVLELWSKVLTAVPSSRIILLASQGFAHRKVLKGLSVDPARIEIIERTSRAGYMRTHHRIDIGLDTLPYNGHTTTLDSLWMGVPVVSLIGNTIVGRAGLSQLRNIGLPNLAVKSQEDFIQTAKSLAEDLPALTQLRAGMRNRMLDSPLTRAKEFTQGVEACYLRFWRSWCER
jgi:protein O-GlcNAc transferase